MTPEHFWPWWAVVAFFISGGLTTLVCMIRFGRNRVTCPNCDHSIHADRFRNHWKECEL